MLKERVMKRAAIGVLLVSLFAGSAAMAGQGYGYAPDHRDPPRASVNDHRDGPAFNRGNDHGRYDGRNDGRHFDNHDRRDYRTGPRSGPPPRVVYHRPAPPRYAVYQPPRGTWCTHGAVVSGCRWRTTSRVT